MRSLVGFLLIFCIIGAILLVVGLGIGFLLHWLIPTVDLGIGTLIGIVTLGFTARLFARIMSLPLGEIDDDPELVEPFTPRITYLIDPEPPRRRRKRKSP